MNWPALLDKLTSRYFLVWVVSAVLYATGKMEDATFRWITAAYIGGGIGSKIGDTIGGRS